MTVVPPPDVSTVRIRLIGDKGTSFEWGNRLYFKYSGTAPTGANCASIASDVASAWNTYLSIVYADGYHLEEVDVLDITTDSGASGQWTGTIAGTRGSTALPIQTALNIEFDIARRYRGGKPRIYLNAGVQTDLANQSTWEPSFISGVQSNWENFIAAIGAISVGAVGTLTHINLSYYQGFTNITNSSGRERAVPKYRDTAKSDVVTGYAYKNVLGSQRRRRTSTSP